MGLNFMAAYRFVFRQPESLFRFVNMADENLPVFIYANCRLKTIDASHRIHKPPTLLNQLHWFFALYTVFSGSLCYIIAPLLIFFTVSHDYSSEF